MAGPMSGMKDYNYPAFNEATEFLRERGYSVLNPARRPVTNSWSWTDYMKMALADVLASEGMATLPGWPSSRGASLEVHVARRLSIPVRPLNDWQPIR